MKTANIIFSFIVLTLALVYLYNHEEPIFNASSAFNIPNEAPNARKEWDRQRLVDPQSGIMPRNIRKNELKFAQNLPNDLNNTNLKWKALGPFNVGGRTRALAIDVTNENILLAGGASGGVWRSTNQGASWSKMTKPFQLHNVTCIDQDTRAGKENIWYHGTGELTGSSASGGDAYFDGNGIYKSIDGGITWDSIPFTADNNAAGAFNIWDFIWNIALDPSNLDQDELYAATYGSIHKSVDGGTSWTEVLGGGSAYYNNVETTTQGIVYASLSSDGTDKGIWRSEDGDEWINILPDSFPSTYGRTAIGINPSNEDEVYFLTAETENEGQYTEVFFGGETWTSLWKYTYLCGDGTGNCANWVNLSENIPANRPTAFDNFNSQGGYDLLVKVKPDDSDVVFIGGTNLWRSTDGFTTDNNTVQIGGYYEGSFHDYGNWDIYENHHPDQHDLLFLPSNNNIILSANDGGVYKSNNCMATPHIWEPLNNGYQTTQLYSVVMGKDTSNLVVGGFQDNGNFLTYSSDITSDWTMPFNGDGSYNAIADDEEHFYLQIQRGVLAKMKLNDKGQVVAFNRMDPLSADTSTYEFINYLAMDPNDDNIIYFPNANQLWRNNSAGEYPLNNSTERTDIGWELFSDETNQAITCIDVSTQPANIVYLGTSNKRIYRIENAHTGDPSFNVINNLPANSTSNISAIEIDPTNADRVLVLTSNYNSYSFFFTKDGGQSWDRVGGNLEENLAGGGNGPSMRTAEIAILESDTLYLVGGSTGLYGTTKLRGHENTIWTQIGTEQFGGVVVENIRYRESDGKLLVGTHGTGIYSTKINSIYDVFPIWSYECNSGACEEKVDGTGSFDLLSECLDSCIIPIADYSIYPNPSTGIVNINLGDNEYSTISIYDLNGKKVKEVNTNELKSLTLDLSPLKKGVYVVKLSDKEKIVSKQLILD